jgi:exopolysaccharide production protein ExoQ
VKSALGTISIADISSFKMRIAALPGAIVVALVIGFLPLANGLVFRSHYFPLTPLWLEPLNLFEFLYVIAEVFLVLWAIDKGMSFKVQFNALTKLNRYLLISFILVFPMGSILFAPNYIYSLIRGSYWIFHIGFAFAISFLVKSVDKALLNRCTNILAAGFLLFCMLVAVHFYIAPVSHYVETKGFSWSAIVPGNLSIRHFGMIAGFVTALFIGMQLTQQSREIPMLNSLAVASLLFGSVFWSGTRSAVLGIALALITVLLFARKPPSIRQFALISGAVAGGLALSIIWIPPDGSFGIIDAFQRTSIIAGPPVDQGRLMLWQESWNMFIEHPLVGWGEGSFYQLLQMSLHMYHLQPHNFIIQFLVSWGIIGGGIALFAMARACFRLHLRLRYAHLMIAPMAALDTILVIAMLDGALFTLRTILPAIFFWILAEKISQKNEINPSGL